MRHFLLHHFFTPSLERCIAFKCRISDVLTFNCVAACLCGATRWNATANSSGTNCITNEICWFNLHVLWHGSDLDAFRKFIIMTMYFSGIEETMSMGWNGLGCKKRIYLIWLQYSLTRRGFDWNKAILWEIPAACWTFLGWSSNSVHSMCCGFVYWNRFYVRCFCYGIRIFVGYPGFPLFIVVKFWYSVLSFRSCSW